MTGGALDLPVGAHYESEISFARDPARGIVVTKTYRAGSECVQWLNRHLARYYDAAKGQPVAQHEHAALSLLEPHGIAPKPLELRRDSIVMEFAGAPILQAPPIPAEAYLAQCRRILEVLEQVGFRHNDLLPANVLVCDGRVRIADFTLSEFGEVRIMPELPNPAWARPGQDGNLLTFLSLRKEAERARTGRLLRLLRRLGFAPRGPRCAGD